MHVLRKRFLPRIRPHHGTEATTRASRIHSRRIRRPQLCQRYCARYAQHTPQPNFFLGASIKISIGILHTIFFHRYFPSLRPSTIEVLDVTLPVVADPQLETLIDTRVGQLVRQLSSDDSSHELRGQIAVQFFEKRRRKGGGLGWFTGTGKTEEEVCWEIWCLDVTIATPRTEAGM